MNKKDDTLFREHTAMANRQGYTGATNPDWAKTLTDKNYQPADDPSRFKELKEGMTKVESFQAMRIAGAGLRSFYPVRFLVSYASQLRLALKVNEATRQS